MTFFLRPECIVCTKTNLCLGSTSRNQVGQFRCTNTTFATSSFHRINLLPERYILHLPLPFASTFLQVRLYYIGVLVMNSPQFALLAVSNRGAQCSLSILFPGLEIAKIESWGRLSTHGWPPIAVHVHLSASKFLFWNFPHFIWKLEIDIGHLDNCIPIEMFLLHNAWQSIVTTNPPHETSTPTPTRRVGYIWFRTPYYASNYATICKILPSS